MALSATMTIVAPARATSLGDYLKAIRESRRLSMERAGARCGIDYTHVSRLEAEKRILTRDVAAKLVAGYGLDRELADRLYLLAGLVPPDLLAAHPLDGMALGFWRSVRRATRDAALDEPGDHLHQRREPDDRQERHADRGRDERQRAGEPHE